MKPYVPRPITFLGVESLGDWRIKLYSLRAAVSSFEPRSMVASALPILDEHLHANRGPFIVAGTDWNSLENYGMGFAMIHVGADAVFLLCDYWVGENMLNHRVWVSAHGEEPRWQSIDATGTSVCVWELAVQAHEREAWIKHVYNPRSQSNFDAYLEDTLTATL
ncbi:MAG: hypothetical protein WCK51_14610 [Armatimonadota bacterium]